MSEEDFYLSKSEFLAFLESPEKYKKMVNDELEVTEDMKLGHRLHEVYERFPTHANFDGQDLDIDKENFPVNDNEKVIKEDMLETLIEFEKKRLETIKELGLDPSTYFEAYTREEEMVSGDLGIRGVPDAIFPEVHPEKGVAIIDLKMDFYDDHKKEMEFYTALVEDVKKLNVVKCVVLSLTDDLGDNNPQVWHRDELDVKARKEEIKEVKDKIRKSDLPTRSREKKEIPQEGEQDGRTGTPS